MTVMLDFNLDSLIFVSPVLFCFCALRHGIIPIVYSVVAYHRVKIFLLHCDTWMLLHVSSVAEIEATLVGSFVRSVLKGDDSVASPQLFLWELALVLLGFLRSNGGLTIFGSLCCWIVTTKMAYIFRLLSGLFDVYNIPYDREPEGRWRQSSDSASPTDRRFGRAPATVHRKFWQLPRMN